MAHTLRPLIVLLCTCGVTVGICCSGFGLWFAPGWANNWPFGLHRNVIWSLGMSGFTFAVFWTLTAGFGAAACAGAEPPRPVWPPGQWYRWWLGISSAVSFVGAAGAFWMFRSQAVAIWP